MSGVDVRMNYAQMNEMAATYGAAGQTLDDTQKEMEKIGNMLEADGLIGDAGALFIEALRSILIGRVGELADKMRQLQDDIKNASDELEFGVATAKSRFS